MMRESLISPILPNLPDNRYIFPFLKKNAKFWLQHVFYSMRHNAVRYGPPGKPCGKLAKMGKLFKWRIWTGDFQMVQKNINPWLRRYSGGDLIRAPDKRARD